MVINYLDYELTPSTHAPDRFDIIRKTVTTKKETGEKGEGRMTVGYGYKLTSALETIAFMELAKENKGKNIELKEYLRELREYF